MKTLDHITQKLTRLVRDEHGAATVDYVVGAAAGVGLAIAVMNSVGGSAHDHANRIGDKMTETGVPTF